MKEIAYIPFNRNISFKKRLNGIWFQKKGMPALAELVAIFECLLFLFVGSLYDTFCMAA